MSEIPNDATEASEEAEAPVPELYFRNAQDFVEQYLLPSWRHSTGGTKWCALWWEHAEAVSILDALWRAFEGHRYGDPSGMAVWWRDFAYPLMGSLTSPQGTFAQCDWGVGEHTLNAIWGTQPPPAGMFVDERELRAVAEPLPDDELD